MQETHNGRENNPTDLPLCPTTSRTDVMHPEFYFDSVYVVFKVENMLFRVSNRLLAKESPKFTALFGLTQPGDSQVADEESGDRSGPIVMPADIKSSDFCCLLKVLYPTSAPVEPVKLSKNEWLSVLHLSTLWSFISLRFAALTQLTTLLFTIDKVMLGRQYFVSAWVLSSYEAIVSKMDTISDEEAEKLGYKTALKLFRLRESRLRPSVGLYVVPNPDAFPRQDVEDAFKDELTAIREKESEFKSESQDLFKEPQNPGLDVTPTPSTSSPRIGAIGLSRTWEIQF